MGILNFWKKKEKTKEISEIKKEEKKPEKVNTSLNGMIIESLKKAGEENIEIIEEILNEELKPQEQIKEDVISNTIGDVLNTGAITAQLAKKYSSVKAINDKTIEVTLTAAEQELLIKFIAPTDLEYWFKQDYLSYWDSVLPRNIKAELRFFVENSILIEEKSTSYKLEYLSDAELKRICKENNLKVSGSKNEKAIRISENLPELAENLTQDRILYKCNEPVKILVEKYKDKIEKEEKEVAEKCINLCFENNYKEAINTYCEWNKDLVFPHDVNTYRLNSMLFETKIIMENIPRILNNIPENVLKDARKIALQDIFFNTNVYVSKYYKTGYKYDLSSCRNLLLNYARNCHTIYEARLNKKERPELDVKFKIHCACDSGACSECCLYSENKFTLDNPPEIPNPNCKNENGCRCCVTPEYNIIKEEK